MQWSVYHYENKIVSKIYTFIKQGNLILINFHLILDKNTSIENDMKFMLEAIVKAIG